MGLRKKIFSTIFAIIVTLTLFFSYTKPVKAQIGPWYNQDFRQWYLKVYDTNMSPPTEVFGERYTAAQVQWVVYGLMSTFINIRDDVGSFVCIMSGGDVTGCTGGVDLGDSSIYQKQPERGVGYIFEKTGGLSGVGYIKSALANAHIIPQTYAQNTTGIGFRMLSPIQEVWKIFRDITYGIFVVIIVVFAFMIMFRVRLNPQTVVTIQSAIPRIVITLLLITFSYAIAGFMLDLMYVAIAIIALIFVNTGLFNAYWNQVFDIITAGPSGAGIFGWGYAFFMTMVEGITGFIWGTNGGLAGLSGLSNAAGHIIGTIFFVGIMIWLIINFIKAAVIFLKTYVTVIIMTIFSPFIIAFGALTPQGGFGSWVKGLLSNLVVFPIGGALLLLAVMFLSASHAGIEQQLENYLLIGINNVFDVNQLGAVWYPPLTVGVQQQGFDPLPVLWIISGIGCIFLIPKVAEIGKGLASGQFNAGAALGAAIGGAWGYGVKYGGGRYVIGAPGAIYQGAAAGVGRWGIQTFVSPFAERAYGVKGGPRKGFGGWIDRSIADSSYRRGWITPYNQSAGAIPRVQIKGKGPA